MMSRPCHHCGMSESHYVHGSIYDAQQGFEGMHEYEPTDHMGTVIPTEQGEVIMVPVVTVPLIDDLEFTDWLDAVQELVRVLPHAVVERLRDDADSELAGRRQAAMDEVRTYEQLEQQAEHGEPDYERFANDEPPAAWPDYVHEGHGQFDHQFFDPYPLF